VTHPGLDAAAARGLRVTRFLPFLAWFPIISLVTAAALTPLAAPAAAT